MGKTLFLDIETIPASNEHRSIMRDQSQENWLKTPLSTFFGRVFCVGVGFTTEEGLTLRAYYGMGAEILSMVHSIGHSYDSVCTWNGQTFDIPFIRNRSIINSVPHVLWDHIHDLDLRAYWHNSIEYKPTIIGSVGMDEVAKLLGLKGKTNHGSNVHAMHKDGRYAEIAEYCLDDVWCLFQIWLRSTRPVRMEYNEVKRELIRVDA